jgi:hypothetical protein
MNAVSTAWISYVERDKNIMMNNQKLMILNEAVLTYILLQELMKTSRNPPSV